MQTLFPNENGEVSYSAQDEKTPWTLIKSRLKQVIDPRDFDIWIKPLTAEVVNDKEIIIILPSIIFYREILDKHIETIESCKSELLPEVFFRFQVQGESGGVELISPDAHEGVDEPVESLDDFSSSISQAAFSRSLSHTSQLNREYTFRNFVNGPSNQFAHASCLAVADAPGQTYNPLFLYGSTGLGKTHLLHAVGNRALSSLTDGVITYISSERFMNEMIYCLRFNKMWDFRKKYRSSDVLLVDDIQFISGKERTQEEFFHTFNALYEAKKQIVVTSDIFPQDIPDIEDRLRNRFQWGLIADIQPPDIEHRIAILMNKADKQRIALTPDLARYIAEHAKGSVRVLEGALRRVAAFAALQGRHLDVELASEILQSVLGESKKRLSIELIQKVVSEHFKIKVSDLKSKKRQRVISIPRQIAMYLARTRTGASFPEIGAKFGGKDHTTIMHAFKKIDQDKDRDLDIKSNIEAVERKLDYMCSD